MRKLQTAVEDETFKALKRLASIHGLSLGEVLDIIVKKWMESPGDLRRLK